MSEDARPAAWYRANGPDASRAEAPWWAARSHAAGARWPGGNGGTGYANGTGYRNGNGNGNGRPHGGDGNGAGGHRNGNGNGSGNGSLSAARLASPVPVALAAGSLLFLALLSGHFFPSPLLARVLIPVIGVLATVAAARFLAPRHLDEPWLARLLVLGVVAKEFASFLRYRTLVNSYGDVGDASVFDTYGRRYSSAWLGKAGAIAPHLDNIRKSNFLRWFTGVVYYLFGADMIAGFIFFGLVAFVGSYLWYRASAEAVPFLDRRLYFLVVMFVPSILFWPSSIGKEALMQFAIGSAALGTAHLFAGRLVRGLLVGLPGAWLMWIVRPHLLALVVLAAAGAYLIGGQRRSSTRTASSSLVKPIGLVIISFILVFAVTQGAKSLGLPSLTLGSVQSELDATTVSTQQGHSAFDNGGNSLSPLHLPQGMITVLLRPFPWEVNSPLTILASFEGIALAAFVLYRRKSIGLSLRHLRTVPFLLYCWILTILYSLTFQAFANFGLLDRQRSLVLPALYVLLCLDVRKARELEGGNGRAAAAANGHAVRGAR